MLTNNKVDCTKGRGDEFRFAEENAINMGTIKNYDTAELQ